MTGTVSHIEDMFFASSEQIGSYYDHVITEINATRSPLVAVMSLICS